MSFIKESSDYQKIIDPKNDKERKLVFYAESSIYFQYYEGIINEILSSSDLIIYYVTSDENDKIFSVNNPRIKSFFIKNTLASLISNMKTNVIVFTMPDLGNLYIKRSKHNVNHVYLFHAIGSTHLQYNKKAFDNYDTLFCIGQHHYDEIRAAEKKYKLKEKELVKCGYYWLEKIYNDHIEYKNKNIVNERKKILIAPSWNKNNILENCIIELASYLENSEYDVIIRPHPEFIKRNGKVVKKIESKLTKCKNIYFELDMTKRTSIHEADILITDWSSISYEYAFGTERPVLFINTPPRVDNKNYKDIGIEPLEFLIRNDIGRTVEIKELENVLKIIEDFVQNRERLKESIISCRNKYVYNFLNSSKIAAQKIIELSNK